MSSIRIKFVSITRQRSGSQG